MLRQKNVGAKKLEEQREKLMKAAIEEFGSMLGPTFFEYVYDDGSPEEASAREERFAISAYESIVFAVRSNNSKMGVITIQAILRATRIVAQRTATHAANH